MENFEELLALENHLMQLAQDAQSEGIKSITDSLEKAVNRVSRAFSGSWLGYHSCIYYSDFATPPPGACFSPEWGFRMSEFADLLDGTKGAWKEYSYEDVKNYIFQLAGNPDIVKAEEKIFLLSKDLIACKEEIRSILTAESNRNSDTFFTSLIEELQNTSLGSKNKIIKRIQPQGSLISRDTTAVSQGIRIPPHIDVYATVYCIKNASQVCEITAAIAKKAAMHLKRISLTKPNSRESGRNIFIGHGRANTWRELKDFIQDRLELPWEEFNRVSIAGVTNVVRLSQMLDTSCIAFLVMTAEDEMADGGMQARMNVIHEVGLFQGRLGFERAIVLLEEGCQEFSNIHGLGQIRFPNGQISACFEDVRLVLEREGIITS